MLYQIESLQCPSYSTSVVLGNLDSNGVSDVGVSKEELQHSGNVKAGLENPKYFDEESSETLTCRAASQD